MTKTRGEVEFKFQVAPSSIKSMGKILRRHVTKFKACENRQRDRYQQRMMNLHVNLQSLQYRSTDRPDLLDGFVSTLSPTVGSLELMHYLELTLLRLVAPGVTCLRPIPNVHTTYFSVFATRNSQGLQILKFNFDDLVVRKRTSEMRFWIRGTRVP